MDERFLRLRPGQALHWRSGCAAHARSTHTPRTHTRGPRRNICPRPAAIRLIAKLDPPARAHYIRLYEYAFRRDQGQSGPHVRRFPTGRACGCSTCCGRGDVRVRPGRGARRAAAEGVAAPRVSPPGGVGRGAEEGLMDTLPPRPAASEFHKSLFELPGLLLSVRPGIEKGCRAAGRTSAGRPGCVRQNVAVDRLDDADCRMNRVSAQVLSIGDWKSAIGNRRWLWSPGTVGPPVGTPDRPGARTSRPAHWRLVHAPVLREPVLEEVAV